MVQELKDASLHQARPSYNSCLFLLAKDLHRLIPLQLVVGRDLLSLPIEVEVVPLCLEGEVGVGVVVGLLPFILGLLRYLHLCR